MYLLPGNAVNRAAPLNRGLVSWWLHLPNRLGGGGSTLRDLMGSNHGTLTNGPLWSGAKNVGGYGSVYMAGTDDLIAGAKNPPNIPITLVCWANTTTASAGNYSLIFGSGISIAGPVQGIAFLYSSDTTPSVYADAVGSAGARIFTGYASGFGVGGWRHLAVTLDGTNLLLYVDGVLKSSSSGSISSITHATTLRVGQRSGGAYWVGNFNDGRVYSRILSASEIAGLYQASRLGYQNELNWQSRPVFSVGQAVATGNRRRRYIICGAAA